MSAHRTTDSYPLSVASIVLGSAIFTSCSGDIAIIPPPSCPSYELQAARIAMDAGQFGRTLDVPTGEEVIVDVTWYADGVPGVTCHRLDPDSGAKLEEMGVSSVSSSAELDEMLGVEAGESDAESDDDQHAYYSFTTEQPGIHRCEGSLQDGTTVPEDCLATSTVVTAWPVKCGATSALDELTLLWTGQATAVEPTCYCDAATADLDCTEVAPDLTAVGASWDGTSLIPAEDGPVEVTLHCTPSSLPVGLCDADIQLTAMEEPDEPT